MNTDELAPGVSYFFAVRPDARALAEILAVADRLKRSHRASGTSVGIDSLHLTLCPMGRLERLRQPLEDALLAAAAEVAVQSFMVTLDTATRFTARNGQFPFVLCADRTSSEAALGLRKALAAAQARVGLQVSGVSSFLPHVSLLHGTAIEPIEEAITPITWLASEFVLIRSFFGESRFEVVGQWSLASAKPSEVMDLMDELANMPDLPDIPDDY